MLRKLNLSFIFLYLFINIAYGVMSPYIIYTIEDFQIPAQNMAELHSQIIPQISHFKPLEIEIIYKETVSEDSLIPYLDTFNNGCSNLEKQSDCIINENCIWDQVNICIEKTSKYLLIIGDETVIDPLSISDICGDNQFSDDFFNINFTTGRLIVNNLQEAIDQVEKNINYITNSNHGLWKNNLLLIADDANNPSNPNSTTEINHTLNTSDIYLNHT